MDRIAKLQASLARKRELLRVIEEEEHARWRVTPEDLVEYARERFIFSEDGSIASLKLQAIPNACVYASFDSDDADRLAPYTVYARRQGDNLWPYVGGGWRLNAKAYWSLGRALLELDDPKYKVVYADGNSLNNTRRNLVICRVGQFPKHTRGRGWLTVRRQAWARAKGVCERCRKQPAVDVHHVVPTRFFERPEDANHLCNLLVVCEPCHREEHRKLLLEMPLFYGAVLPVAKIAESCA